MSFKASSILHILGVHQTSYAKTSGHRTDGTQPGGQNANYQNRGNFFVHSGIKGVLTQSTCWPHQLSARFPKYFDGEDKDRRLYFAVRWLYSCHKIRRSRRVNSTGTLDNGMKGNTNVNDSIKKISPSGKVRATEDVFDSSQTQANHQDFQAINHIKSSTSQARFTSESLSTVTSTPASSPKFLLHRLPNSGDTELEVYNFLDSCLPSMAHHFSAFKKYGCNSGEDLLGISTWHPRSIENFLGKLPANDEGEYLSEMEKAHMTNHFLQYF